MRLTSTLVLALLLLAVPALACDTAALAAGVICGADLAVQAQAYAAPVQAVVQPYVQQQVRVVQRVVQPQAVYVAPQAVVLQQKVHAASVIQHQVVTPYVQQNLAVSSYGASNVAALRVGRQRLAVGASQRVVTKSKTVTSTGRGGLLGRVLGR